MTRDGVRVLEINIEQTVQEVETVFWRYDQALIDNDVDVLNERFRDSDHTLRYGITENIYGQEEIAGFCTERNDGPFLRKVTKLVVTAYGPDHARTNCETVRKDTGLVGRQSHTWVQFDEGWRIVAAHVSTLK